jgi:hypothetical protein
LHPPKRQKTSIYISGKGQQFEGSHKTKAAANQKSRTLISVHYHPGKFVSVFGAVKDIWQMRQPHKYKVGHYISSKAKKSIN